MRIYKNDNGRGYATLFSNKSFGLKMYVSVQFKKDCEPQVNEKGYVDISLSNWFGSCYTKQNGVLAPKIVVLEYQILSDISKQPPLTDNDDPFKDEPKEYY